MNPKFAYSVLIALRCSGRGSSAFRTLVFFLNIFIIDSPVRAGGSPARPPRVAYAPSNFSLIFANTASYEAVLRIIPNNLNEWMLIGKRVLLGSAIRERRERQSLSQKLALMIGSSKSHIWRIESGRVSVGLDDLRPVSPTPSTCKVRDPLLF
ncbi:MAG: helix-turn-helix domain-containing protein [Eggerthella lenta]